MEKFTKNAELFLTDIYVASYLNKNYKPLPNRKGYIKKAGEVSLFTLENLEPLFDEYDIINFFDLTNDQVKILKNFKFKPRVTKTKGIVLGFDEEYFKKMGTKFKKIRQATNRYRNLITQVTDMPLNFSDFKSFIKKWQVQSKGKYFMMTTGVDTHFVKSLIDVYKDRLISKFFYIGEEMVGFSIIERVGEGLYNNIFCKTLTKYPLLTLFIDSYMFDLLRDENDDFFIVHLGSAERNSNLFRYKTRTYPTDCFMYDINNVRLYITNK